MAKYRVDLSAWASLSIVVEVPDGLDDDEARQAAIEEAFQDAPSDVCAQCSGWRRNFELEIGDWNIAKDPTTGRDYEPEQVNR